MRVPAAATVLASSLIALACDGGSGSPTAPAPPPAAGGVRFSAAAPGDAAIALRGVATGASLEVEVYAVGVDDLYGLSFELRFPANLLRYESHGGGAFPNLEIRETAAGQLLVGATHLGAVAGLSGGGTVLVVRFTAVANGSGPFDFAAEEAFDGFGDRLALDWHGGTVSVDL